MKTEFKPQHTVLVIVTYLVLILGCAAIFSSCTTERSGCQMAKGYIGTH